MHMVNCYISLPPPQLRRTLVIKRFMQDQAASAINARAATTLTGGTMTTPPGATTSGSAKKSRLSTLTTPYARAPSAPRADQDAVSRELADLRNQVRNLRAQALPNPPLPNLVNRPPIWPTRMGNSCPDLPDDVLARTSLRTLSVAVRRAGRRPPAQTSLKTEAQTTKSQCPAAPELNNPSEMEALPSS